VPGHTFSKKLARLVKRGGHLKGGEVEKIEGGGEERDGSLGKKRREDPKGG